MLDIVFFRFNLARTVFASQKSRLVPSWFAVCLVHTIGLRV